MAKKKKEELIKLDHDEAHHLADFIADILNNTIHHYWLSDSDATSATAACYKKLRAALDKANALAFRIIDGALIINGDVMREKTHNIEIFVDHMESLEIANFTISKDIDEDNFTNLLEILEAHPAELEQLGGFTTCLERFNVKGVESKKLIFQEVSEGEIVIDEKDLGSGDAGPGGTSEHEVGNILAFLKGDTAGGEDALKQVQETAADPSQMAELILKSAEVQQAENPLEGGETMVDFVVGCLRRTYDGLTQQKSARTKTGKKRITRNLMLLEKEVLDRMRELSEEWTDDDLQAIVDATQEMTDELKIDSMADEFLSSQKTSEEMEKKMLDYIQSVGIDNVDLLKDKLASKGMDIGDWQELVIKSGSGGEGIGPGAGSDNGVDEGDAPGAGPGKGAGDGGAGLGLAGGLGMGSGFSMGSLIEAIGNLDVVLANMEKGFDQTVGGNRQNDSSELIHALEDVTGQMRSIATGTGEKIDFLVNNVHADEDTINSAEEKAIAAGVELNMTRRDMLKILADIIREIYEPLIVISTSLEMLKSDTMGGINEEQTHTITLAEESLSLIASLLHKLENVSTQD